MWLKHYIFMRMLPNNQKGKGIIQASMATFIISSIWHGFYPGFFVFFMAAAVVDYQAKLAGQSLYPLVENWMPGWLIYIGCYVWCYISCGYFATAFVLLSYENFHKVYASMYYIWHIVIFIALVISFLLLPKRSKDSKVSS